MVSFESDYICGAHPKVLDALIRTNLEPLAGYGSDRYCESAKEKIRKAVGMPGSEVEFIAGGTQTNAVVISTMLADHEGVVAAASGHISAHEAGAVEYTGHEVLTLPQKMGKIVPEDLEKFVKEFYEDENHEHMTYPGMVYISHPTEYGTLYTKEELTAISGICRKYDMKLFLDGARLAYGLMSRDTDVTLQDIARLCDVFYIGGTKAGALCGEAVVFQKGAKPKHFLTSVKRRGALLAKGRLLGVQFDALFTDGLYFDIGSYAIEKAEELKKIFAENNIRTFIESPTNQQFAILENAFMEKLKKKVSFSYWEKYDKDHTVVRFASSWSTTDEDIEELKKAMEECRA